jgi:putative sterol carrier protein
MAITSVQDVLDNIGRVDKSQIEGLDAVILFNLSGEGGGTWTATIADGTIKVEEGETATPGMTLSMDAKDLVALSKGELNAVAAFMQGRIKVTGDMSLAMRLQSILT